MPSPKKTNDVAWGFFVTISGHRLLRTFESPALAGMWRAVHKSWDRHPGPIFRITPPKKKKK